MHTSLVACTCMPCQRAQVTCQAACCMPKAEPKLECPAGAHRGPGRAGVPGQPGGQAALRGVRAGAALQRRGGPHLPGRVRAAAGTPCLPLTFAGCVWEHALEVCAIPCQTTPCEQGCAHEDMRHRMCNCWVYLFECHNPMQSQCCARLACRSLVTCTKTHA